LRAVVTMAENKKVLVSGLLLAAALVLLLAPPLPAETVTLPAVTSLPVGAAASPFFSDVRVFNTSYTASVSVTAVYRCFLGTCPGVAPQSSFVLGPRESRAFDDMIFGAFAAPSSAGAVEFTSAGDSVRVTSRLYSPVVSGGTNGMFVPGLKGSQAHAVSVLTGLSNGLFRTNVGIYNGNDVGVTATIRLFNGGVLLGTHAVNLGGRSGTQVNRIFDVVGQGGLATTNAVAVVESSNAGAPLFSYAAVIDNATSDSSFVAGEQDVQGPAGPAATATPLPPVAPTPTPTPTQVASATVVELVARTFSYSFNGGGNVFTMRVGQTYELRARSTDVAHGMSAIAALGLQDLVLFGGSAPVVQIVTPTAAQIGSHPFECTVECGTGHPFFGRIDVVP
jgi:hypothetical protein